MGKQELPTVEGGGPGGERCEKCYYATEGGEAAFTCQRFPPEYHKGWPPMAAHDWCGEFRPRPEAQDDTTKPDLFESPLYLLAVLYSARRSKDRPLERLTRDRLKKLGVKVQFGNEARPS